MVISKTLVVWHGSEETEDSSGAAITFSTDELASIAKPYERAIETYILKNRRGEVVAELTIAKGAHAREV